MKKSIKAFLDRIEGDIAVIYFGEDEDYKVDIPVKFLPKEISENIHLKIDFSIDKKVTKEKGNSVDDLRKRLMEGSN